MFVRQRVGRYVLGAAIGCFLISGCSLSSEERVVGIYSIDPIKTDVPDIQVPAIQSRLREVQRNTRLKLLSDKTFVLTGAKITEGTWHLQSDSVVLELDPGSDLALLAEKGRVKANVVQGSPDLTIQRETPLGNVRLYLRKTG